MLYSINTWIQNYISNEKPLPHWKTYFTHKTISSPAYHQKSNDHMQKASRIPLKKVTSKKFQGSPPPTPPTNKHITETCKGCHAWWQHALLTLGLWKRVASESSPIAAICQPITTDHANTQSRHHNKSNQSYQLTFRPRAIWLAQASNGQC